MPKLSNEISAIPEVYGDEVLEGALDIISQVTPEFVPEDLTDLRVLPFNYGETPGAIYRGMFKDRRHLIILHSQFGPKVNIDWDDPIFGLDVMKVVHELYHQVNLETWGSDKYFTPAFAAYCKNLEITGRSTLELIDEIRGAASAGNLTTRFPALKLAAIESFAFLGEKACQMYTGLPTPYIPWYESIFGPLEDRVIESSLNKSRQISDIIPRMRALLNVDPDKLISFQNDLELLAEITGGTLGVWEELLEQCQRN